MSKKILLVEDEENLHDVIKLNLELEGFDVVSAVDGKMALEKFKKDQFDIVLLDVMLPFVDGFEVCRQIRLTDQTTPVLFLTAKGTGEDRIKGLKIGADDYLVKPFQLEELILRVGKLIGRKPLVQVEKKINDFTFGNFRIDFNSFEIFEKGKQKAELTKKEIALLKLLIENNGNVVSREEILDKVWGEDVFPSSRTIDNFILMFRKYFEKNPKEPIYFHSVRGVGYKFTA